MSAGSTVPGSQVGGDRLRRADLIVGFNILNFDYHVLMGYTILDLIAELPTADLMADMEKRLGHRLGLDAIAHATLGIQKTAAGLDAIRWWREGRLLEIAEYCCFDVKVTRLVELGEIVDLQAGATLIAEGDEAEDDDRVAADRGDQ